MVDFFASSQVSQLRYDLALGVAWDVRTALLGLTLTALLGLTLTALLGILLAPLVGYAVHFI